MPRTISVSSSTSVRTPSVSHINIAFSQSAEDVDVVDMSRTLHRVIRTLQTIGNSGAALNKDEDYGKTHLKEANKSNPVQFVEQQKPKKPKKKGNRVPQRKLNYFEEENKARNNWPGRADFVFACLGYAIGTGDLISFPASFIKYGVGYVVPYLIATVVLALPVVVIEMALGQFSSRGFLTCWKFAPLIRGIGFAMAFTSLITMVYYHSTIAMAVLYGAQTLSLGEEMPWFTCDHSFNTQFCTARANFRMNCTSTGLLKVHDNGTCYNITTGRLAGLWNETLANSHGISMNLSTREYLEYYTLRKNSDYTLENLGGLDWRLWLAYAGSWCFVLISLIRGIKSVGKALIVTVLFTWVFIGACLIYNLVMAGDLSVLVSKLTSIDSLKVEWMWREATRHALFSLGGGYGVYISLASHNRFHNNCLRDALIVVIADVMTALASAMFVLSAMNNLSVHRGINLWDIADSDIGILFVVFFEAAKLTFSTRGAVIVMLAMYITSGLSSQFLFGSSLITATSDLLPMLHRHLFKQVLLLSVFVCACGCLVCTWGRAYVARLLAHFLGGWNIFFLALTEIVAVVFIYGLKNFLSDMEVMLGEDTGCCGFGCQKRVLGFLWLVLTPLGLGTLIVSTWANTKVLVHGSYRYHTYAQVFGWLLSLSGVICLALAALYKLWRAEGTLRERLRDLTTPNVFWGPALKIHRELFDDLVPDPWGKQATDVVMPDELWNWDGKRLEGKSNV